MSSHPHNPRVLVTGAGGPAGVSVIRSLNAVACVFAIDIDPCAVGLYLVGSERRALVPRGEDFDFVDRIIDLCRRWQIDVVVPTVDTELLPFADGRERFKELGCRGYCRLEACTFDMSRQMAPGLHGRVNRSLSGHLSDRRRVRSVGIPVVALYC